MFTKAIEKVSNFTRPIHTITRLYNTTEVIPGTATIFLVNEEGWALTCKHVIQILAAADQVNKEYEIFKGELKALKDDPDLETKRTELEQKFKYDENTIIQIKNTFIGCVDKVTGFQWHVHPKYDLALLKFQGFDKVNCNEFPIFQSDEDYLRQGKFLCRLGYPFPEFTNFKYNNEIDSIEWTNEGQSHSPKFPIDGMITRFLGNEGKVYGIEMSIPGLRGQSGGPLFNEQGVIQGMQFATQHLHLVWSSPKLDT